MRAAGLRYLLWPAGIAGLAALAGVVLGLPDSTYGGHYALLLGLEISAAVALLALASVQPDGGPFVVSALCGATWLVPELAGWAGGPALASTLADAWGRVLPALIVLVAMTQVGQVEQVSLRRVLAAVSLLGGTVAALARLFLVDPFLDPGCWRVCAHNPLLVTSAASSGRGLEAAGAVVVAGCAVWVAVGATTRSWRGRSWRGRSWRGLWGPRAPTGLTVILLAGSSGPGLARIALPESATSSVFRALFVLAQVGAVGVAAIAVHERFRQWRLGERLTRLAGTLQSSPTASVADGLRRALGDPQLQVLYWAQARGGYVDGDGDVVVPPLGEEGRRTTQVARQNQPVAALVHASGVDGARLDRALGAALRLGLHNEQLRAAALAELRELRLSRTRIVERAGIERGRLERNLHDGAQQRVVSLALLVRLVGNRIDAAQAAREPETRSTAQRAERSALIARAEMLTRATIDELRRVARGIHPAVLADSGLSGAIQDLAEASPDVAICVGELTPGRYGGSVETTTYRVAAGAIADARARGAGTVSVSLARCADRLVLDLRDDGAPGTTANVAGLNDQVGALCGSLVVDAAAAGTRVRLELPCGS